MAIFVSYSAKTVTRERRPAGLLALSWLQDLSRYRELDKWTETVRITVWSAGNFPACRRQ